MYDLRKAYGDNMFKLIDKVKMIFICTFIAVCLTACGGDDEVKTTTTGIFTTVKDTTKSTDDERTSASESDDSTRDEGTTILTTTVPTTTVPTTTVAPTTTPTPIPNTVVPTEPPATIPTTTEPPMSYNISVYSTEASGRLVKEMNGYTIDYSNVSRGYVMIKNSTAAVTYIWIKKEGITYQYKMGNTGGYEAFPINMGNGKYEIIILAVENGLGYEKNKLETSVTLENGNYPYLYPNQLVYFNSSSYAVDLSYQICYGLSNDGDKVNAIYNYIISNISYNYDRANKISSGEISEYIPSPDNTLYSSMGICSDYSSLFAAMCRAQKIPCKMVYGYINNGAYHAWNQAYYNGSWHFFDATIASSGGNAGNYIQDKQY